MPRILTVDDSRTVRMILTKQVAELGLMTRKLRNAARSPE